MGGPDVCPSCDMGSRLPAFEALSDPLDELTLFIKEVDKDS